MMGPTRGFIMRVTAGPPGWVSLEFEAVIYGRDLDLIRTRE
jgi:hypothetical protein